MRIITLMIFLAFISSVNAQEKKTSAFRDSTDNAFDVSDFLITQKGLLPVPVLITEPAIGYGGALGLLFFHDSYENRKNPPSISGVFGGLTENGTWMAGTLHAGFWKQDKIRYVGSVGVVNINIDYYGPLPKPVKMNVSTWFIMQQIQFRIGESNFFIGAKYFLSPTTNTFKLPIDLPEFSGIEFETTLSEVSAMFIYDSRNNVISPTQGIWAQINPLFSDTWLGGDSRYGIINASFVGLQTIQGKWVLGGKLVANSKLGDIPFYTKPFIQMRGVPAMKYQDNNIVSFEGEVDWNIHKRWHLIGFAGVGSTFKKYKDINEANNVVSGGGGFRYLLARKFGMKMGMDFALSQDDFAFYVTMGHAWAF